MKTDIANVTEILDKAIFVLQYYEITAKDYIWKDMEHKEFTVDDDEIEVLKDLLDILDRTRNLWK